MERDKRRLKTNYLLISFVNQYSRVLGKQISGTRTLIEDAVGQVMTGINEIASATQQGATEATKVLEETYFNTDDKTLELVGSIQSSVDQLFELAQQGLEDTHTIPDSLADTRLRRFGGKFSKHMEALSTLDQEIGKLLMQMVGALSADDVIRQKLEHLSHHIETLEESLSIFIADLHPQVSTEQFNLLREKLLCQTYKQYTCEEEKVVFAQVFGTELTEHIKNLTRRKAS